MTQRRNTQLDGLPLATALALCVGLVLWIGRDQGTHAAAPRTLAMVPREVLRQAAVDVAAPHTPFGTRSVDELLEGLFDPPVLRREDGQVVPARRAVPVDEAADSDAPAPEPHWVALQDGDGRVLAEGRMLGDLPDGPWLFRGAGGERLAAGVFQAGVPDGPWQAWHEDGSLREALAYAEGLPEGLRVEWWPNGVKALEGRYEGGQRSELWSTWHENGALRSQGRYEDGLREGAWAEWHADGNVHCAAHYTAGRRDGAFRAWHDNGAMAETGEFVNGLREGLWGFFTPDGQRERRSGMYVAGVRQRE